MLATVLRDARGMIALLPRQGAVVATSASHASRPPRLLVSLCARHPCMHRQIARHAIASVPPRSWTWERVFPGEGRGISGSVPLRTGVEGEDTAIQWSGSFDGKLKMIMMESAALERELCENPTPDRQAVIGESRFAMGMPGVVLYICMTMDRCRSAHTHTTTTTTTTMKPSRGRRLE